jgi:SecD/SecF fusion protein
MRWLDWVLQVLQEWTMTRFREAVVWSLALVVTTTLAGCGHATPGVELVYVLDPPPQGPQGAMLVDSTAQVMEERLGDAGEVHALPNGQIVVLLYGHPSAAALAALKQRVSTVGDLEFRIMASESVAAHRSVIEDARKLTESDADVEQTGKTVARWAALNPLEFRTLEEADERGLETRMAGTAPQALVLVNDGLNVGGRHLKEVHPDIDEKGKPQLGFSFDAKGAFLFGQLTGQHTPTPAGQRFHLGILIDGTVMSAPRIESKITGRGRMSGNMTKEDVDALTAILSAGQLPSAVKLVSEKELQ